MSNQPQVKDSAIDVMATFIRQLWGRGQGGEAAWARKVYAAMLAIERESEIRSLERIADEVLDYVSTILATWDRGDKKNVSHLFVVFGQRLGQAPTVAVQALAIRFMQFAPEVQVANLNAAVVIKVTDSMREIFKEVVQEVAKEQARTPGRGRDGWRQDAVDAAAKELGLTRFDLPVTIAPLPVSRVEDGDPGTKRDKHGCSY